MIQTALSWETCDKTYLWHPFTQMLEYSQEEPLVITAGEGNYLIDIHGRRYLDGVSSLWCNTFGHRHPRLTRAIKEQADIIAHSTLLGISHTPAIALAQKLVEITPRNLTRVNFSDSGATSVEIALKIAFQYWQNRGSHKEKNKTRFLSLTNGYHGDTIGSVSVGGIDLFHQVYNPLLFKGYRAPTPYCYRCSLNLTPQSCNLACAQSVEETLAEHHREIAAMIIEPLVQGAAGIITHPPGYLKRVSKACQQHNVLFIADEVAVGFGKTGSMFACEQEEVEPDILCVAKGLTGGYLPVAATLTTETIYEVFLGAPESHRTFYHGHTYAGNPLGCAVALETIDIFREDNIIAELQPKIAYLKEGLQHFRELQHVGDIRQRGLMVGLEMVADGDTREPMAEKLNIGHRVILEARRLGVILRPLGNVIVLMPNLVTSESEIDELISVTRESIRRVCREL